MKTKIQSTCGSLTASKEMIARIIMETLLFPQQGDYTFHINVDAEGSVVIERICIVKEAA